MVVPWTPSAELVVRKIAEHSRGCLPPFPQLWCTSFGLTKGVRRRYELFAAFAVKPYATWRKKNPAAHEELR